MARKVWVKRQGSSPTQVTISEDDLVDDVRDVILRKYSNSLGRSFDSPDITLRIQTREGANGGAERVLAPDQHIGQTLETYYPGGQTVKEALIIEIPKRRTPRPSPLAGHHMPYYIAEEVAAGDLPGEYFPPMPVMASPVIPPHISQSAELHNPPIHSMAVLTSGQLPTLPSPGGRSYRHHGHSSKHRPRTASPTVLQSIPSQSSLVDANQTMSAASIPPAPPLPIPSPVLGHTDRILSIIPPGKASSSPHPNQNSRRSKKAAPGTPNTSNPKSNSNADPQLPPKPASAGLLDGTVPPINVLIVEDNVINLKLLEAFMKRLKVRWKPAMNGKEAVAMWRQGGFHLVLMDIQLPVMNGLDATKEIRRLEMLNGIGVFSGSPIDGASKGTSNANGETLLKDEDKLEDRTLFKSPVIVVALTASSLQSDRHEALAAGCNDFLTKPVNFVWMERKVTEWGCMQALIDFDGWRKWKDYANTTQNANNKSKALTEKDEKDEKAAAKAALRAAFAKGPPSKAERTALAAGGATTTTAPNQSQQARGPVTSTSMVRKPSAVSTMTGNSNNIISSIQH